MSDTTAEGFRRLMDDSPKSDVSAGGAAFLLPSSAAGHPHI
jgi:hypothetical protein